MSLEATDSQAMLYLDQSTSHNFTDQMIVLYEKCEFLLDFYHHFDDFTMIWTENKRSIRLLVIGKESS